MERNRLSVSAFMEIRGFLSYKMGKRNSRIGVPLVFGLWSEGKCICLLQLKVFGQFRSLALYSAVASRNLNEMQMHLQQSEKCLTKFKPLSSTAVNSSDKWNKLRRLFQTFGLVIIGGVCRSLYQK